MTDQRDVILLFGERALLRTIDDLWSAIRVPEIKTLRPETVEIARQVHQVVWHDGEGEP